MYVLWETYNELVNNLLMQYSDEQLRNTIINGFQHLTPVKFQLNLEKIVLNSMIVSINFV